MKTDASNRRPVPTSSRWLKHPTMSIVIGISWLLLQQSLALPQLITAVVLGIGLPRLIDPFLGGLLRMRRMRTALWLVAAVFRDIVESNIVVARIVLSPRTHPQPAWLRVPMAIRHPVGQVLLASIITNTPGTVSCSIDEDEQVINVHALNCTDAGAIVDTIKRRYERPLMEILE